MTDLPRPPDVADVLAVLDLLYDPARAEGWDSVGLVCGDPGAPVRRVLFAVDPVLEVVEEAVDRGVDLLVTHHPLLLHPVHAVATSDPRGLVLHRLLRAGIALVVVHTNADVAEDGVSDALAATVGLHSTRPLRPLPGPEMDGLSVFVPTPDAARLRSALAAAGAGTLGDYTEASWQTAGTGRFRPGPRAHPALGTPGELASVVEARIDVVVPRARRAGVVAALRAAHPYEEPAFDLHELVTLPGRAGLGRIGSLRAPEPFAAFCRRVAAALPATPAGVRGAGAADAPVLTVAVCGGAGDGLLGAAADAGVDVYLTADLRHHPASGARAPRTDGRGGARARPMLLEVTHWAGEWPWLASAAARVSGVLADSGAQPPAMAVSALVTDPWTLRC